MGGIILLTTGSKELILRGKEAKRGECTEKGNGEQVHVSEARHKSTFFENNFGCPIKH